MGNILLKTRLFIQPFILVAIGTIALYSLVHGLYIYCGLDLLNQEVVEYFIPIALPIIPIYIWLYPRYKLIQARKGKDQDFNMALFAAVAIIAPLIISQMYLDKAVGSLVKLDNTTEINTKPQSKYYELKNCYFDKQYAGFHGKSDVSGRHSQDLNFHIYVALPIFKDADDTANNVNTLWLGRVYNKTVGNHGTEEEKDKKYDDFRKTVIEDFDTRDFKQFVYLKREPKSEDRNNFIKAIDRSGKAHPQTLNILTAETEPFENRTGSLLQWIFIAFGIGTVVYSLIALFQKIDMDKLQLYQAGKPTEEEDPDSSVWRLLVPKKDFFITPILLDLNIGIYLVMVFCGLGIMSFSSDDLLKWGADYRPLTINGQWWRLVTSMFLHGGLMHIVGNMVGLLFVGAFLEPVLGRAKYLFAYLVTGIISSGASIWWHVATVSVGASGAIFGLFGVFLALLLLKVFPDGVKKSMLVVTLLFIGYNLAMGLTGGIDNAAHIGGLISGLVLGVIFSFTLEKQQLVKETPGTDA